MSLEESIATLNGIFIGLPRFIIFANFKSEGAHIDHEFRGYNLIIGFEDLECVLVIDNCSFWVVLFIDLSDFYI